MIKYTETNFHLNIFKIEIQRINAVYLKKHRLISESYQWFWLLNAGPGYLTHYIRMFHSHIAAMVTFHDGPKTYYTISKMLLTYSHTRKVDWIGNTTTYFSSLVNFQIFKNTPYKNQTLLSLYFKKTPGKRIESNNSHSIQIASKITAPLHELYTIQPKDGSSLSVSFQVRQFRGSTMGSCYYGGYTLLEYKSKYETNSFEYGPYCNTSYSNYPLVGEKGLQKLVFGNQKIVLLFYAYSPIYTIDLDIIIQQPRCQGILNPITFCSHHYFLRDRSSSYETYVTRANYSLNCIKYSNIAYMRLILGPVCMIVQQTHMRTRLNYHMRIAGFSKIQLSFSFPFSYNTSFPIHTQRVVKFTSILANYTTHILILNNASENVLSYNDAISAELLWKHDKVSYHQPSYAAEFDHDVHHMSPCVNINSSHHSRLAKDIMHLKLVNNCGTGYYKEQNVYVFELARYKLTKVDKLNKIKYYFSLFNIDQCSLSRGVRDRLSLYLGSYIAQSMIFNQSELHVITHDMRAKILYYKYSSANCSTFKIVFHRQTYQLLTTIHVKVWIDDVTIKVR